MNCIKHGGMGVRVGVSVGTTTVLVAVLVAVCVAVLVGGTGVEVWVLVGGVVAVDVAVPVTPGVLQPVGAL